MTIDEMILKLDKLQDEAMYLEDEIYEMEAKGADAEKILNNALENAKEIQMCIGDAINLLRMIEQANLPF